jgi:hypothetical protein
MKEVEFGYRVRQALNEGAQRLDYKTTLRLEKARKAALEKYRPGAPELAWARPTQVAGGPQMDGDQGGPWLWAQRLGLAVPLVALMIGFVGVHEWQRARTIDEMAAIDFALLLDEAPVQAYADKGFGVFLKTGEAQ